MKGLFNYWENLASRERAVLIIGSLILVATLSYIFLWEPWNKNLQRLRAQVPEKQKTLAWMENQAGLAVSLQGKQKRKTQKRNIPLLTVIEKTAVQAKIKPFIKRIQPGKDKQVKVWFSDALFDSWLLWIEGLKNQNIEVIAATVNRSNPNRVSITVTLQQAG